MGKREYVSYNLFVPVRLGTASNILLNILEFVYRGYETFQSGWAGRGKRIGARAVTQI